MSTFGGSQQPPIFKPEDLECHFKWKPEEKSTKMGELKTVIEHIKKKMRRHPQNAIAYRCTLAYLYTTEECLDYGKALELLEQEPPEKELQQDSGRWFECEFIVRANLLFINRSWGRNEDPACLEGLTDLWESDKVKASVYAVKGITFNCFGPNKYSDSKDAYEKALEMNSSGLDLLNDWQKFEINWGLANANARIGRGKKFYKYKPTDDEINIWNEANSLATKLNIQDPEFYANFAEAIMMLEKPEHVNLCEELIRKAHNLMIQLSDEKKLDNSMVYHIIHKVYDRLKNSHHKVSDEEYKKLEDEACEYLVDDPNHLVWYLKDCCRDDEKAIKLLKEAKEKFGNSNRHHLIDMELVKRKKLNCTSEETLRNYNILETEYKDIKSTEFVLIAIKFDKIRFLFEERPQEAFQALFQAKTEFTEFKLRGSWYGKIKDKLESSPTKEHLAWFLDNFSLKDKSERIVRLFSRTINDTNADLKRKQFAREHLGNHFMKKKKYTDAREQFKRLISTDAQQINSATLERAQKRFAMAIKEDGYSQLEECKECLTFKLDIDTSREIGEKILSELENEKDNFDAKQYLFDLSKKGCFSFNNEKFFFSRHTYEVCARIDSFLDVKDGSWDQTRKDETRERIYSYLEIDKSTTQVDRQKIFRSHRLAATKLKLEQDKSQDVNKQKDKDFCNDIVKILWDARNELDRSFDERFPDLSSLSFHYPFAYKSIITDMALPTTTSAQAVTPKQEIIEVRNKKLEQLLMNKDGITIKTVKDGLEKEFRKVAKKGDTFSKVDKELNFFVNREHYILTKQAAWLVRWIDCVNIEKHTREMTVKAFQDFLTKDSETAGIDPALTLKAYDVAHLAAEFAEQTRIVLNSSTTSMSQNAASI